jgi:site-specific DNA-methyltransferase (adenine-specific)
MDDNSIDSIVTDPPYGLSFMGKGWDYDVPKKEIWQEALRVLKPGGHLLAFFGSRTYHRGAVQIEDAGFEIRDQIMWLYGSGFPKSHNVSKGIDKMAGAERTVKKGVKPGHEDFANRETKGHLAGKDGNEGWKRPWMESEDANDYHYDFEPATDEAKQWEGWGTALKPAHEPIVVARKPFKGTVVQNVLEHGTGALNIDECRVGHVTVDDGNLAQNPHLRGKIKGGNGGNIFPTETESRVVEVNPLGRWPANVIHDGSDEVTENFPVSKDGFAVQRNRDGEVHNKIYGAYRKPSAPDIGYGSSGSAARFFYCAKASKSDRDEGLEDFQAKMPAASEFRPNHMEKALAGEDGNPYGRWQPRQNIHPTVKPTELMRYLCRLVTPKNGVVLDPFMGSGTTGKAAAKEGFNFIGVEMTKEYFEIAEARIKYAYENKPSVLSTFFTEE